VFIGWARVAVGDVRLDGREDLIRRFAQRGEKLASAVTDEELVLHVVHAFGESGVAEMDGDYSIVLWTAQRKSFWDFRDLTGSKPFFYFAGEGALCVTIPMDTLRASRGFDEALRREFSRRIICLRVVSNDERTITGDSKAGARACSGIFAGRDQSAARGAIADRRSDPIQTRRGLRRAIPRILHNAVKDRLANESKRSVL